LAGNEPVTIKRVFYYRNLFSLLLTTIYSDIESNKIKSIYFRNGKLVSRNTG